MEDREQGQRVAGRIIYELEAVGILALILGVAAMVTLDAPAQKWYALGGFMFVAAVAFGLLANAVLRR